MKKVLVLMFIVCFCTMTFAEEVITTGLWKDVPKPLRKYSSIVLGKVNDGVALLSINEYKERKLAVLDENMQVLRERKLDWKEYLPTTGDLSYQVIGNTLNCINIYRDAKGKGNALMNTSYDLTSLSRIKDERLMDQVEHEAGAADLANNFGVLNFNKISCKRSENNEYVAIVAHYITKWRRCVNLIVCDSHLNIIAQAPKIDYFRIPKMKIKEYDKNIEDYDFDYDISNDGKLTFISSISRRFLQSSGSDLAVYELSKDGLKQHKYGKVMAMTQIYSPNILQIKDGKLLAFGVYAPVAERKEFQLEGNAIFEFDLETDKAVIAEKKPFDSSIDAAWKKFNIFSSEEIYRLGGQVWNISNGWIKTQVRYKNGTAYTDALFIDSEGHITSTYPLRKNADQSNMLVYNDKLYYSLLYKDGIYRIDKNGEEKTFSVPYEHLLDKNISLNTQLSDGTYSFFKKATGSFMFETLQIKE